MDRPSLVPMQCASCSFVKPVPALLCQRRATGHLYPNSSLIRDESTEQLFVALGWIIAQTAPNRAMLGAPLSPAVFSYLLSVLNGERWVPSMEELGSFDPEAQTNILKVL